jgi:hypothetical protein
MSKDLKTLHPGGIRTRDLLFWRRTRRPLCHAVFVSLRSSDWWPGHSGRRICHRNRRSWVRILLCSSLIANPISQFVLSTLLFRQFVLSSLLQVRKYILIWEVFNVADNNGARILYIWTYLMWVPRYIRLNSSLLKTIRWKLWEKSFSYKQINNHTQFVKIAEPQSRHFSDEKSWL